MMACTMVGGVWPTLRVPGISSSLTRRRARNAAVVGANEPMPRVSKKLVMKPKSSRSIKWPPVARAHQTYPASGAFDQPPEAWVAAERRERGVHAEQPGRQHVRNLEQPLDPVQRLLLPARDEIRVGQHV